MSCRRSLLLFLIAAMVGIPHAVLGSPPVVDRLPSGPGEIRVRVVFEAPTWVEETLDGRNYRYPAWDGLPSLGDEGGPGLPTYLLQVAVPPTGRIELVADEVTRGSAGGVRFPPLPHRPPAPTRARGVRPEPTLVPGEGPGYASTPPAPAAELVSVGVVRGVRIATVAVRPTVWRVDTGEASWFREVSVTLRGGREPRTPRRLPPDGAGRATWSGTLVNPQDAEAWTVAVADSVPPAGIPDVWFDDAEGWAKIRVTHNGIYALGASDLQQAGVPVDTIDPRSLRLFSGPLVPDIPWANIGWDTVANFSSFQLDTGYRHVYERPGFTLGFADTGGVGERAILVEGEEDGSFDSGDRVVFYALGPDNYRDRFGLPLDTKEDWFENPYSDETVYWLAWGGNFPGDPLRMESVSAAPGAGPPVESTRTRFHSERNTIYDPSMRLPPYRWERWFWESMDSPGGHRFRIELPDLVPGTDLDLTMRLWGAQVPLAGGTGEEGRHHVRVTINGVDGGLYAWGASVPAASAFAPYDVGLAGMPSANPCEVICAIPTVGTNPDRYDKVHLVWIDFVYDRILDLSGMAGEVEIAPGASDRTLRISSVPNGELLVLDVSDARHPRRLVGAEHTGSILDVGWTATARGVLAAAPLASLSSPAAVALDTHPARWLRDPGEPLDYVIVSADELATEAEILASWRRQHLYPYTGAREARVRVVRVSDIWDEFAWGMKDPVALRYFLEYAYRYYGQPGSDPLAYCLFLGDASNDPRNFGLSGSRDDLPSWEDNRESFSYIGEGNVQYVTDDPLACFDGRDSQGRPDLHPDLYLGRITARTRTEAAQLLRNKVIRTEESPDYGSWRDKMILVTDDACQGTATDGVGLFHIRQTGSLIQVIPPRFDLDKIYLWEYGTECIYNSKPAAKKALIDSWTEGACLVNYVGHGGDVVWADEHVLDLADTPLLGNEGRYPVVCSFSCSVGKFSQPVGEGLGESHLRAPKGGSLVSVAATHLTSPGNNLALNSYFLEELTPDDDPGGLVPIGVALMRAKWRFPIGASLKYACLGDPASLPCIPRERLDLTTPSALNRGETITVTARLEGGGLRSGTLDLLTRDASIPRVAARSEYDTAEYTLPGAILFRGETDVEADSARVTFTLPFTLRGGSDGRVRAYGWGEDWDAVGVATPLPVGGTTFEVSDTTGPAITFSLENGDGTRAGESVEAALEDPAGINLTQLFEFQSVLLQVLDHEGVEVLRQDLTSRFAYEKGSTQKGRVSFAVPDLTPGEYTFQLSATDNYNNRSRASLDLVLGGGAASGAVFTDFTAAYPNPFDPGAGPTQLVYHLNQAAVVSVRIFSISGRLVLQGSQEGRAGPNYFPWDGRDERLDPVANGVYLVRLATRGTGGDEDTRLERVVVLR